MSTPPSPAGGKLFIVDNSDGRWNGLHYLRRVQAPLGVAPVFKC